MKQIILGTAGHIDHGKTSLIKAVTGTNTDRLKEEKLRGITIELGFASLDLPGGQHLGIVDVPGHEKFIKNMVAGATGIDIVAMVIAADEGIMPQTREHIEICSLLNVKHGLIVLTKTDLVDEEWLELVMDDIQAFMQGTFLESAPIVQVSSVTGSGIPEFINTLENLCKDIPEHPGSSLFRLPVDRVFTIKGFGTVITGSLISGRIKIGDIINIYPSKIESKVRGIQVHNQSVEQAVAGMRTAINFQGLEKTSIKRGDVLARPDTLHSSYMLDVLLNFLKTNEKPLKNRTQVRFHTGTSEILGNIILIDRDELNPGESAVVQIRLDEPVAVVKDDRFVIRSYSPVRTIGGGDILNPIPVKHKRFRKDVIKGFKELTSNDILRIISYHAESSDFKGVCLFDLMLMTNMPEKKLRSTIQTMLSSKTLTLTDKDKQIYIHEIILERLKNNILSFLENYHRDNPLKPGMSKQELKSKFPFVLETKVFNLLLQQMIKEKKILLEEDIVRLASHKAALAGDETNIKDKILEAYKNSGLMPPYFKDLIASLKIDPAQTRDVLLFLVDKGRLIKVREELYFDVQALETLKNKLIAHLKKHEEITTPEFKTMTKASRKYVIPIIEYFDAKKITIRVGDIRKLRETGSLIYFNC
ncbi:Selenocysteine-specific elongation factor [Candidatus Magnetomoraceae bacterium gMMP-15]